MNTAAIQRRAFASSRHFFLLCLVVVIFVNTVPFSQAQKQEVFAGVPAQFRARLADRLNLLIQYQRREQWAKVYDLLSDLYTQGKSKKQYVKSTQRWYAKGLGNKLISFDPKSINVPRGAKENGEWAIYGCAKLREKGRIVKYYASVIAVRDKGDWFFSDVGIVTQVGGLPEPCPY